MRFVEKKIIFFVNTLRFVQKAIVLFFVCMKKTKRLSEVLFQGGKKVFPICLSIFLESDCYVKNMNTGLQKKHR